MTASSAHYDVIAIGYSCIDYIVPVDSLPKLDEKLIVPNFLIQGGGPAATAMVAVARLGGRAALVTALGDDASGREILDGLADEGVDASFAVVRPGGSSAFAFCMIERGSGLRTIVGRPTDVVLCAPQDVPASAIASAKVLLVDGCQVEAQREACRIAREAGVAVIFDAGNEKSGMEELIELCDVVIASHGFASDVCGTTDPAEGAARLRKRGASVAGVTAGAAGAFFHTDSGRFHQRAFGVRVVDTTGAGDAFHGGYAYGMAQGWDERGCARFGAAVAALKCRALGGRTALPSLEETEEFLAGGPREL